MGRDHCERTMDSSSRTSKWVVCTQFGRVHGPCFPRLLTSRPCGSETLRCADTIVPVLRSDTDLPVVDVEETMGGTETLSLVNS